MSFSTPIPAAFWKPQIGPCELQGQWCRHCIHGCACPCVGVHVDEFVFAMSKRWLCVGINSSRRVVWAQTKRANENARQEKSHTRQREQQTRRTTKGKATMRRMRWWRLVVVRVERYQYEHPKPTVHPHVATINQEGLLWNGREQQQRRRNAWRE